MLSVLIIDSEMYKYYGKYAYFFNWFEENKNVAICIWNKIPGSRAGIDELVPQLLEVIKNAEEWNAYIVDKPFRSIDYLEKDFQLKTQYSINPYERSRDGLENYNPEKDQLLKLIYLLGGRGVEERKYIEAYHFRAVRPTHIFLITPRIFEDLELQKKFLQQEIVGEIPRIEDDPMAVLTEKGYITEQYADFWSRYEYPPNCRFLVFDMPNEKSNSYADAWFMLWLAIISMTQNTFKSAELAALKLYTLRVDISSEELSNFLNKFYTVLLGASEANVKEMENEVLAIKQALADTTSNPPVECSPVFVHFPDVDMDDFFADPTVFGIAKDTPTNDADEWRIVEERATASTGLLFKATERGKKEAIDSMLQTYKFDLPIVKARPITKYDAEDITETLNRDEIEMLELETNYKASRSSFEKNRNDASNKVKAYLKTRMRYKTMIGVLISGMIIYLAGFIPFMINSFKHNTWSFIISLIITIAATGLIGISCGIAMRFLKRRMYLVIGEYNNSMNDNLESVEYGAQIQSKYLTMLLNYMEKYQMLTSGRIDDNRVKKLREMGRIGANYTSALEQCTAIANLCHLNLERLTSFEDEYLMNIDSERIYLHEDTEGIKMKLNSAENVLNTPFAFVTGLGLSEEILYECPAYFQNVDVYDIKTDVIESANLSNDEKGGE